MNLPDYKNRRAVYVEGREARAVIIENIQIQGTLVQIQINADVSIPHLRTWLEDEPYQERNDIESSWILSSSKDTVVLDENYAQGPLVGWQLLIEDRTFGKFSAKDDRWVGEWF